MRLHQLFDDTDARAAILKAQRDATERLARLTPQQRVVLDGMIDGHPNKVIAYQLGLSIRTVENHRAEIMMRLDVKSVAAALRLVVIAG